MGAHARVDVAESTAAATRHSRSERSDRRANHALDLDVSGAASPGADVVARMLRTRNCPVPAQSRCRCGQGCAQSRCRCGSGTASLRRATAVTRLLAQRRPTIGRVCGGVLPPGVAQLCARSHALTGLACDNDDSAGEVPTCATVGTCDTTVWPWPSLTIDSSKRRRNVNVPMGIGARASSFSARVSYNSLTHV